ncbi:hypothetical protein MJI20_31720, partial [Salmonella enterica subsp. enterica serovar Anatum]|nr:hypothetical protein [Salmonella enterica subsp. enterica serovar Anatum]
MQLRKLLLPGLLSVTLLSGCSLFSGEEDVVKMSPLPQVENQQLNDELERIRQRGWSFDNGEDYPDVRCVAAPVFNARNELTA